MFGLGCKFLFVTIVIVGCYGAIDITKYLKVCDRNSVDLNDCMVEAVQMGLATMAVGINDLGVPSVDPYHQNELKMEYNRNQISAKMHIKDVYVEGLMGATVHDARVKVDDDRLHIEIDLTAPLVTIRGSYKGQGQYNALEINANGEFNTTMTGLEWTWKLDGTPEKIGSDTFVRIKSLYMRPNVESMVINLSNEDTASKEWTNLGNTFVNANWRVLYSELVPYAQANWNKTGSRIANKIFMKVPYDQIFPISP